jgi:glycosyltransferase involved in cell wall biosynthesis
MANPLAAVNTVARRGHDVTVLSADPATYDLIQGSDWALVDLIDPRVKVVRVRQPPGVRDPVINRWHDTRLLAPGIWEKIDAEQTTVIHPDPILNPWFPAWRPAASAAARALHDHAPFDLVIANILPAVAAGVALSVNLATGIPMVLVERDSWVFSPYTGQPYDDAALSRPLLEEIMSRAVQVWYINQPLAHLHRREFPAWAHKIKEVRNAWDAEFIPEQITPPSRAGRDGLVFRFVGTMAPRGFPWQFVEEAWTLAREASPVVRASVLEFVGPGSRLAESRSEIGMRAADRVPKGGLAELYAQTDALLFIKEGGGMVTSGKIYEYLATGLPIVTSLVPDHDARAVLAGRPLWFDAKEHTPQGLAEAFVRAAAQAPVPQETAGAHRHAAAYRRDNVMDAALAQLEEELGW